jgi:protein-S-isoprenylcysteine O-methyltransferase Ste14
MHKSPIDTSVVFLTAIPVSTYCLKGGAPWVPPASRVTIPKPHVPPLLYLACLILGLMLDRVLALPLTLPEVDLVRWAAGGGLILLGIAIFAAGVRNFSRAATPVPSTRPVRTLVTTGIHGLSRNPIYVGMFLLYAGIGVAAQSP